MMMDLPMAATADGVRLAVKVTPKAAHERIEGIVADADGRPRLKVAVTAAAEHGRANAAVLALLARVLHRPLSAFTLERGAGGRRKTLRIEGEITQLRTSLAAALPGAASEHRARR